MIPLVSYFSTPRFCADLFLYLEVVWYLCECRCKIEAIMQLIQVNWKHRPGACACTSATSTIYNSKQSGTLSCSRCTVIATKAWWLGDDHASVAKLKLLSYSYALTVSNVHHGSFVLTFSILAKCLCVRPNTSFTSRLMVDGKGK